MLHALIAATSEVPFLDIGYSLSENMISDSAQAKNIINNVNNYEKKQKASREFIRKVERARLRASSF